MRAIDAFLNGILDYAGLFPPAQLSFDDARREWRELRRQPHAAMLGKFVLPLDQLAQAPALGNVTLVAKGERVLLPELPPAVTSIEVAGSLANAAGRFVFHEIDWRGDFASAIRALAGRPLTGVKLRTGGVTAGAIPPVEAVAQFLAVCGSAGVPVKFTAGLHSPVPYDDPATGARHHGFLNVFAAGFAACADRSQAFILEDILRSGPEAFAFHDDTFEAAGFHFPVGIIEEFRRDRVISFGSCSFLEPVEHLKALGFL